jgi:hypothetical protein
VLAVTYVIYVKLCSRNTPVRVHAFIPSIFFHGLVILGMESNTALVGGKW